jgi:hypothetical protein
VRRVGCGPSPAARITDPERVLDIGAGAGAVSPSALWGRRPRRTGVTDVGAETMKGEAPFEYDADGASLD